MSRVDELLAFVAERLEEEERDARAAMGHTDHRWYAVPDHKATDDATVALLVEAEAQDMAHWSVDRRILSSQSSSYPDPDDVPWLVHAAQQDPRATLARVAALRALVAPHRPVPLAAGSTWLECAQCIWPREDREDWPCEVIRGIAAIWAWHPDYSEAWRVEA